MPKNYRVRTHQRVNEKITISDTWFEELDQATDFAKNSNSHHVKIYNQENKIIDEITSNSSDQNSPDK
jgi:hypothetical protein